MGFRKQEHFNDPLEAVLAPVDPGANAKKILKRMKEFDGKEPPDVIKHVIEISQTFMSALSVGMNCVVLCLTRNPSNPLMWAHYSGLTGMVIGYDVDSEFFLGTHNACPVQFGEMVYSDSRPNPFFEEDQKAPVDRWYWKPFDEDNLERVQATFLTKAKRWEYEEEIRIVKRLNDESEDHIREEITCEDGRDLYLYRLPENCIREVYRYFHPMVLHALKNSPGVGGGEAPKEFRDFIVDKLGLDLFAVTPSKETWDFAVEKVP